MKPLFWSASRKPLPFGAVLPSQCWPASTGRTHWEIHLPPPLEILRYLVSKASSNSLIYAQLIFWIGINQRILRSLEDKMKLDEVADLIKSIKFKIKIKTQNQFFELYLFPLSFPRWTLCLSLSVPCLASLFPFWSLKWDQVDQCSFNGSVQFKKYFVFLTNSSMSFSVLNEVLLHVLPNANDCADVHVQGPNFPELLDFHAGVHFLLKNHSK